VAEARHLPGMRFYRPLGSDAADILPCLVFAHGGGWVFGDLDTHDHLARSLANAAGCAVLAVDYRLAPEHRFPAAVEDVAAGLCYAVAQAATLGIDPTRLAVGGDSAGGNLAAVAALLLPCLAIVDQFVIQREERYLAAKFGADYEAYRQKVRRWL
jgi:acetyl esterase/lipase